MESKRYVINYMLIFIMVLSVLSGCASESSGKSPDFMDRKMAVDIRIVEYQPDQNILKGILLLSEQDEDQKEYCISLENCQLYIDQECLTADYPVIVVLSEKIDPSGDYFEATKIYGFSN